MSEREKRAEVLAKGTTRSASYPQRKTEMMSVHWFEGSTGARNSFIGEYSGTP